MRRLLFPLFSLTLLAFAFGCNHTAGVCDCEVGRDWCHYGRQCTTNTIQPVSAVMPVGLAPVVPEQLQEGPREVPLKTLPPIRK